jgi:hypothetical protein
VAEIINGHRILRQVSVFQDTNKNVKICVSLTFMIHMPIVAFRFLQMLFGKHFPVHYIILSAI